LLCKREEEVRKRKKQMSGGEDIRGRLQKPGKRVKKEERRRMVAIY
jgi:hypothetical protein